MEQKYKNRLLPEIANHLILCGGFCQYQGLLKGKMGIAIFFYELYRETKDKMYSDFAGDLIDDIYENMSLYSSNFFNDGLAGIGWGFEYLIRNKFVEANADEVLESIDNQIMERDIRKISETDLDIGLKGIAHYMLSRCANRENIIIDKGYLMDMLQSLQRQAAKDTEIQSLHMLLTSALQKQQIPNDGLIALNPIVESIKYEEDNIFDDKRSLGIMDNGYAGIGFKLLKS